MTTDEVLRKANAFVELWFPHFVEHVRLRGIDQATMSRDVVVCIRVRRIGANRIREGDSGSADC